MKITEFIQDYKKQNFMGNVTALSAYIKKVLEVKDYIPFIEKREICRKVLMASCKSVGNTVEVDSISRYLLFTIAIISNYTNLEFENSDDKDSIDEYDMLCQNDLLNPILEAIGAEYTTCNNVLNMMMADIVANNNSVAVLDKSAQKVLDNLDKITNAIVEKIEELNLDFSQIDIDKYKGLLEKK